VQPWLHSLVAALAWRRCGADLVEPKDHGSRVGRLALWTALGAFPVDIYAY